MKNQGGTAFPFVVPSYSLQFENEDGKLETDFTHESEDGGADADPGMMLRDYFASAAMQSLASGYVDQVSAEPEFSENLARLARVSYRMADAMISEREKED